MLHLVLLVLVATGGSGCIEVGETVRVGDDGAVDYTIDFGMPEFLVVAVGETFGGQSPDSGALFLRGRPPAALVNGDSVWTSEYVRGDLRHFVSRRAMTSPERLVEEGERPDSLQDRIAPVLEGYEVKRLDGHQIRLRRIAFPSQSRKDLRGMSDRGDGGVGDFLRDREKQRRIFAGRRYSLTIHAPRIVSTNGTLSEDRTTATWSIPMEETVSDSAKVLEAVLQLR
ncbi:MAG TPA: hypothetical protein VFM17_05140 [Candidatus Eisenbacteria bacterium]|nr:hypothetical protein [Candidatus Eisenbacteria bacterium]